MAGNESGRALPFAPDPEPYTVHVASAASLPLTPMLSPAYLAYPGTPVASFPAEEQVFLNEWDTDGDGLLSAEEIIKAFRQKLGGSIQIGSFPQEFHAQLQVSLAPLLPKPSPLACALKALRVRACLGALAGQVRHGRHNARLVNSCVDPPHMWAHLASSPTSPLALTLAPRVAQCRRVTPTLVRWGETVRQPHGSIAMMY